MRATRLLACLAGGVLFIVGCGEKNPGEIEAEKYPQITPLPKEEQGKWRTNPGYEQKGPTPPPGGR